jgi:hypothetical protein
MATSNAPLISWYNATDLTTPISSLDMGEVDAGSESNIFPIYVFNNKNGTSIRSNCESSKITTKDVNGGMDLVPLVKEKWIQIMDETMNTQFTPVGCDFIATPAPDGTYTEVALPVCANDSTITHSATAPSSPADGQLWYDTTNHSTTGDVCKKYDGATSTWKQYNYISGAINDGTIANSAKNFIKINVKASVPSSSIAGKYDWKLRLRYSFV